MRQEPLWINRLVGLFILQTSITSNVCSSSGHPTMQSYSMCFRKRTNAHRSHLTACASPRQLLVWSVLHSHHSSSWCFFQPHAVQPRHHRDAHRVPLAFRPFNSCCFFTGSSVALTCNIGRANSLLNSSSHGQIFFCWHSTQRFLDLTLWPPLFASSLLLVLSEVLFFLLPLPKVSSLS